MRVPHALRAYVDPAKVREYLLAEPHPDGAGKARLLARFGYSPDRWRQLEADLRRHVQTRRVTAEIVTSFGTKYVVRGILRTRNGRDLDLVTVWIIRNGESFPRFVTAHPGGSRR